MIEIKKFKLNPLAPEFVPARSKMGESLQPGYPVNGAWSNPMLQNMNNHSAASSTPLSFMPMPLLNPAAYMAWGPQPSMGNFPPWMQYPYFPPSNPQPVIP